MGGAAVIDPAGDDTDLSTPASARWRLDATLAPDVQKLVVSGFGQLSASRALLLRAEKPGGAWIGALQAIVPVTPADAHGPPALALAFTSLGLRQVGLAPSLVDAFAPPFVEGMMEPKRRERLGDVGSAVRSPIIWGPREDKPAGKPPAPGVTAAVPAEEVGPVHALALLYDVDHASLDALVARIEAAIEPIGVTILRDKTLDLMGDGVAKSREHFGFVDGISQPIPYGEHVRDAAGGEKRPDPIHGVRLGEILLGYPDAHANTTRGPFYVAPSAPAQHDLARNGTYLVVRELDQDVEHFWDCMRTAAAALNHDADWLAARVVGRTRDGHMLRPQGPLPKTPEGPDNDFLYLEDDGDGLGCPMGSHIRRANPRDGLTPKGKVQFCEDMLRSANAHRLLRRGRKYGGGIAGGKPDDTRGLLFMCLNTDIARQFEFVQQNWMLNPNFCALYDEVDPLVGPKGKMTMPARPLRRKVEVATFVTLAGGDYFFLPSLSTLRILAGLRPSSA